MENNMGLSKVICRVCLFIFFLFPVSCYASEEADYKLKEIEKDIQLQGEQVQQKIELIDEYYNRGKAHLQKDNFDKAIADFEEVLKILPSHKPAQLYRETAAMGKKAYLANKYYNQGRNYLLKTDYDEAIASFEKALKELPSYKPAKLYREVAAMDKQADLANKYYKKGKIYYRRGDFKKAASNFEEALKLASYNEHLKMYFNSAIIQYKIALKNSKIESIKLGMADIIADYDKRIKKTEGLAIGYLLEQALLRCQAGDFTGAEYYYNLCYKLDPTNKEKVNWFVNATYELKNLSDSLNECYKELEELPEAEVEP